MLDYELVIGLVLNGWLGMGLGSTFKDNPPTKKIIFAVVLIVGSAIAWAYFINYSITNVLNPWYLFIPIISTIVVGVLAIWISLKFL